MSARRTVLLVLALVAAPLAGCLVGSEDDLDPQGSLDPTNDTPVPGERTQVYQASTDGPPEQVDPDEALGDLPLPAGLGRQVHAPLFEPTIGVLSNGTLFVSNAESDPVLEASSGEIPDDTRFSGILRSTDEGQSWTDVTDNVGPVSIPPNTFDPYVHVDPETDRVYNLDMIGLNCNWVRFSDDAGQTWTNNPLGCGQPLFEDHPTIFTGDPTTLTTTTYENAVYICVNRLADSACSTSLDGGLTWTPWRTVYPGAQADGFCGGLHAHGTTGPNGTAYLPKGQCGTPSVAISEDNGLTWEIVAISEEVEATGHEVAFAVDDRGNAFAFWIGGDLHPYLAVSTDGGHTWRDPVDVAPPNVSTTSHPTIAAGENGSIAMAYVGTTTEANYSDMSDNATWNGYLSTVLDARAENVTVATTTANEPASPIGRGVCGGTRCRAPNAGGGLGDFIDVTIDDEGRPWAAFVDVCHEECEEPGGPSEARNATGLVGTVSQGPALVGPPTPLPSLATTETEP